MCQNRYDTPTMPANVREIKGRMKAVGNIERITKTMQMIATARFQAMQRRATAAQAYTQKIGEVVTELADSVGDLEGGSNPLLTAPEDKAGKICLLVLTSNRGLCGGFNANLLRKAGNFLKSQQDNGLQLEVGAKKGNGFFKFSGQQVDIFHDQFESDSPTFEEVNQIAERYMYEFTAGQYDAVHVVYMSFISMARQEPVVMQLLPMAKPKGSGEDKMHAETLYDFSPEPVALLEELLPITVKTRLFQCFNETLVSEQLARMVAMKAATDSAGKMSKSLGRQYNRARQSAITTELSEIIGGAAALDA